MVFKYDRKDRRQPITLIELIRVENFKMSQFEFGKCLNRGQSTIARWEHSNPDFRSLPQGSDLIGIKKLSQELGARVSDKKIFEIAEGKLAK